VSFEALNPILNQLNRHLADHFIDLFVSQTRLVWHHLLIKALDERKVLLRQESRLVIAVNLVAMLAALTRMLVFKLTPLRGLTLFFRKLGDDTSEL